MLSPSNVTVNLTAKKKIAVSRISREHSLLAVFVCVAHDELSVRGTTCTRSYHTLTVSEERLFQVITANVTAKERFIPQLKISVLSIRQTTTGL